MCLYITVFNKVVLIEKRSLNVYAVHFAKSENISREDDQKGKSSIKLFVSFKSFQKLFSSRIICSFWCYACCVSVYLLCSVFGNTAFSRGLQMHRIQNVETLMKFLRLSQQFFMNCILLFKFFSFS